ncbi:MAG: Uncharacterised protein [Prochlorococcus marinus str. MIT 9313]|nr:MAG: Uncharacterised protein [Prochlorococcus marinus str. MIT 9313]
MTIALILLYASLYLSEVKSGRASEDPTVLSRTAATGISSVGMDLLKVVSRETLTLY